MVKTEIGPEKIALKRECGDYRLPAIASSEQIRSLYEIIGREEDNAGVEGMSTTEDPLCMVFEWMEHDSANITFGPVSTALEPS